MSEASTGSRALEARHPTEARLLGEDDVVGREPNPRLRVLGPDMAAGSQPAPVVESPRLDVAEGGVALLGEPLVIDARTAFRTEIAAELPAMTLADEMGGR